MGAGKRVLGSFGSRLPHLDGLRGLAALFVLVHHAFCMAYPIGLGVTATGLVGSVFGWVIYGHFGVTVFIVLAGYSLTLGVARREGELPGGFWTYMARRAWRIIPPYWAALLLTLALSLTLIGQKTGTHWDQSVPDEGINPLAFIVNALLLQDVISVQNPAYTFWSVAVEWHIYLLLPIMLVIRRRSTWRVAVTIGAGLGIAVVIISQFVPSVGRIGIASLWPTYYAVFALAVGACVMVRTGPTASRRVPWMLMALLFVTPVLIVAGLNPYPLVAQNYFWIDLLVGSSTICFIVALETGVAPRTRATLSWKPLAIVGLFSYSLYLVHAPLLQVFWQFVILPFGWAGPFALVGLWALCVPLTIVAAYGFYLVAERPFVLMAQRRRAALAHETGGNLQPLEQCPEAAKRPVR